MIKNLKVQHTVVDGRVRREFKVEERTCDNFYDPFFIIKRPPLPPLPPLPGGAGTYRFSLSSAIGIGFAN